MLFSIIIRDTKENLHLGGKMKKFFHDYSYNIVKMFVNQFAISLFGFSLTLATTQIYVDRKSSSGFDTLTLIVSLFAIIFYLFLNYTLAWEIGAKDRISVDSGKKPYRPHLGLILAAIANIPNLIIAVLFAIGTIFKANSMIFIVRFIGTLIQGMYFGIITAISLPIGGEYVQLNSLWPTFFLITVPAMLTSWLAYFWGFKEFRLLSTIFNKSNQAASSDTDKK